MELSGSYIERYKIQLYLANDRNYLNNIWGKKYWFWRNKWIFYLFHNASIILNLMYVLKMINNLIGVLYH